MQKVQSDRVRLINWDAFMWCQNICKLSGYWVLSLNPKVTIVAMVVVRAWVSQLQFSYANMKLVIMMFTGGHNSWVICTEPSVSGSDESFAFGDGPWTSSEETKTWITTLAWQPKLEEPVVGMWIPSRSYFDAGMKDDRSTIMLLGFIFVQKNNAQDRLFLGIYKMRSATPMLYTSKHPSNVTI